MSKKIKSLVLMMTITSITLLTVCLVPTNFSQTCLGTPIFQKGMSYAGWTSGAYADPKSNKSLARLAETNTEWVAICVCWYQKDIYSTEIYANSSRTPTTTSVEQTIARAHELGMNVMLKPMVDPENVGEIVDGEYIWRGLIGKNFTVDERAQWFNSYANFINSFAELAEQYDVEMFCVGCEFASLEKWNENWTQIIANVTQRYHGPITYAAHMWYYKNIVWWGSVDYVGIDAYFPLTNKYDPTLNELKHSWNTWANDIESWHSQVNNPILFTETGYRSYNGTNMEPGEPQNHTQSVDLQEQVDCYEAAFQTLWNRNWFYSFYWWHWQTDPNYGGPSNDDFTPQNKPVQYLITSWYSLNTLRIGTPSRTPSGDVTPDQQVKVSVCLTGGDGTETVILLYTTDNGTSWFNMPMIYNSTTSLYEATIPKQQNCTWVKYKIVAYDKAGNYAVEKGESSIYVYHVPEFPTSLILLLFLVMTLMAVIGKHALGTGARTRKKGIYFSCLMSS